MLKAFLASRPGLTTPKFHGMANNTRLGDKLEKTTIIYCATLDLNRIFRLYAHSFDGNTNSCGQLYLIHVMSRVIVALTVIVQIGLTRLIMLFVNVIQDFSPPHVMKCSLNMNRTTPRIMKAMKSQGNYTMFNPWKKLVGLSPLIRWLQWPCKPVLRLVRKIAIVEQDYILMAVAINIHFLSDMVKGFKMNMPRPSSICLQEISLFQNQIPSPQQACRSSMITRVVWFWL